MNAFIEFLTLDNLTYMLFGLVWSVIYGVIVVLVGTILGIIGAALKISKHKVLLALCFLPGGALALITILKG